MSDANKPAATHPWPAGLPSVEETMDALGEGADCEGFSIPEVEAALHARDAAWAAELLALRPREAALVLALEAVVAHAILPPSLVAQARAALKEATEGQGALAGGEAPALNAPLRGMEEADPMALIVASRNAPRKAGACTFGTVGCPHATRAECDGNAPRESCHDFEPDTAMEIMRCSRCGERAPKRNAPRSEAALAEVESAIAAYGRDKRSCLCGEAKPTCWGVAFGVMGDEHCIYFGCDQCCTHEQGPEGHCKPLVSDRAAPPKETP